MSFLDIVRRILDGEKATYSLSLILLNTPCNHLLSFIKRLWSTFKTTGYVVCADGGANRLYDALKPEERESYLPNFICGDLDSVREEVLKYYKTKGSEVVKLEDQDYTDFMKSIAYLVKEKLGKNSTIVAYNGLFGRGDQVFGCVQTLFEAVKIDPSVTVYLLSDESIMRLLQPGSHVVPCNTGLEESHSGLVPVGEPVRSISTTGLQWNLYEDTLSFGGLISTCNLFEKNQTEVTITTSHPVIWSMAHLLASIGP